MPPDDAAAGKRFVEIRRPNGPHCPHCGPIHVRGGVKHKTMPYRCRSCRKRFSIRTKAAMDSSNLGYQVWTTAISLLTNSLKGVSSMKLHRDLNVTQQSARLCCQDPAA